MSRRWRVALAALMLAACGARAQTDPVAIEVKAAAIPLNPRSLTQARVGSLTYAGGLVLKADNKAFGGLSGLDVAEDGSFIAVTDAGDVLRGRLVLNRQGRLRGVAQATLSHLSDEHGRPYPTKMSADAEDVALTGDGGFVVSFEQRHRVLIYAADGAVRRMPPPPGARLGSNKGLEALAVWRDPRSGAERLVMGAERGDGWSCDLDGADCRQFLHAERDNPGEDFRLTGLDALPNGELGALYRGASLLGGLRAVVARVHPGAARPVTVLARLSGPVSVDNMEGIAAVPKADGSVRLYLISDDNFAWWQRTLLLAFDWKPPPVIPESAGRAYPGPTQR